MSEQETITVAVRGPIHTRDAQFRSLRKGQVVLSDDLIITGTIVRLGWMDRLRALCGRTIFVHMGVPVRLIVHSDGGDVEVWPGDTESRAHVEHLVTRRHLTIGSSESPQ